MDESVDVEDIEKLVDVECEEVEQRGKQEQDAAEAENKEESESGKLSNLISSFFHHDGEAAAAQLPEKEIPAASAEKPEKETDDGGSSSGLVDSLIAKLPSPLSDEAAPETEEASILIHSIVHD